MKPSNKTFLFTIILLVSASLLLLTACGGNQTDAAVESGADLELGQQVFQANCSPCHSTQNDTVLVGPSMVGLADRAGQLVEGLDAEAYIRQSILEPEIYLNEGYQNLMPPTYGQQLSAEELDALVAYLFTIGK